MPAQTPEAQAREKIDAQLGAAGWGVQDVGDVSVPASRGVAVREFPDRGGERITTHMRTIASGRPAPADHLLTNSMGSQSLHK